MNIFLITLFHSLVLFFSQPAFAVEDQRQIFEQAYHYCEQGKYEQACKLYTSINNKGFIVLYNMSLVYLNLDDDAQAILYAKRAEKVACFSQLTLLYDLFNFIKKKNNSDYVVSFYELTTIFIKKCMLSIPMIALQILLLIIMIFLILSWYNSWYQIYRNMIIYILLFFIVCRASYSYKNYYIHKPIGIVVKSKAAVFTGPDTSFYKKAELTKADEVVIIGKQEKYYQVKTKHVVGWVADESIELV